MNNLAGQVVLGGAQFSIGATLNDELAVETIRAAAVAGIRIFDTARAYAPAHEPTHNEHLFARALAETPGARVATKGGHFRRPDGLWAVDNTAKRLRSDVETSLAALRTERLDLYYLHRADDTTVPLEESVGTLDELRREGKIAHVGVSNATVAQLELARTLTSIDAVQNRLTLNDVGDPTVRWCEMNHAVFFAYSPFGGPNRSKQLPRLCPRLARVADEMGISLHRLVLSGILALSPVVSVIVGAGRPQTARDAAGSTAADWNGVAAAACNGDRG